MSTPVVASPGSSRAVVAVSTTPLPGTIPGAGTARNSFRGGTIDHLIAGIDICADIRRSTPGFVARQ
jgi:hypothetical protein